MPTIWREDGYRFFFFFSNESNEPPHVHVEKGDGYAKLWLSTPPLLTYSQGFGPGELRRAREIAEAHVVEFLERWHDFFGA